MSKAQLDKFIKHVSNDPAAMQEATKGTEDLNEFLKNVQQYAKKKGYDFTDDEVKAWITQHKQQLPSGELADSQLEAVAGGATVTLPGGFRFTYSSGPG